MAKHYIFSDTHHGSDKVVDYLKGKAKKEGKITVSSTGDFATYAANDNAPSHLNHPWSDAYKKGDKAGMKKYEKAWLNKKVIPYTKQSGEKLQELKPFLEDGSINAIYGNSDYIVGKMTDKAGGGEMRDLLGGKKSAVRHINHIQVKKQGKTTFVYVPHNADLLSKYKDKGYLDIKGSLSKDKNYQDELKRIAGQIGR
jgi:hypothetical protein